MVSARSSAPPRSLGPGALDAVLALFEGRDASRFRRRSAAPFARTPRWLASMCAAARSSRSGSRSSLSTRTQSKRLRSGGASPVFSARLRCGSNANPFGFVAASTAHRALSVATIPALATESVCCSIAS